MRKLFTMLIAVLTTIVLISAVGFATTNSNFATTTGQEEVTPVLQAEQVVADFQNGITNNTQVTQFAVLTNTAINTRLTIPISAIAVSQAEKPAMKTEGTANAALIVVTGSQMVANFAQSATMTFSSS